MIFFFEWRNIFPKYTRWYSWKVANIARLFVYSVRRGVRNRNAIFSDNNDKPMIRPLLYASNYHIVTDLLYDFLEILFRWLRQNYPLLVV